MLLKKKARLITTMELSGDGFYSYAKWENNDWAVPVNWTRSKAINVGNATNNIKPLTPLCSCQLGQHKARGDAFSSVF
jgi:hypothetical protein